MATVGPVTLSILPAPPDQVVVQVSYEIIGGGDDIASGQPYREVVELIGVDKGQPGEDGVDDVIDVIEEETWIFDGTHVSVQRQPQSSTQPPHLTRTPIRFSPRR
ncbi:hypothetical protein [Nocardioides sp. B-3]|uniref:hypothetical protein n=1 Tax=Nocardioides sp. B-3 TaxID=2895565 RepID=UPI00215222EF|nr:hypothetical protein [Nocardioides sp. B-3]UUZ57654.1 hypothetical protein LP418_14450 [Nocardioides sp. B-3]